MREGRPPGGNAASRAGARMRSRPNSDLREAHPEDMAPEALAPILAEVPLFRGLSRRARLRIAKAAKVTRVSAGQHICREGFSAEAFYILLTGTAVVETSHGTRATLSRGDFFGELGLIDARPRTANVIAETDLWAARLPKDRFATLVDHEPAIARGIMEVLVARIRGVEVAADARDDGGQ
jgi:CRP/FNR family transcriptional regulator, cyclic AMP receptor protein